MQRQANTRRARPSCWLALMLAASACDVPAAPSGKAVPIELARPTLIPGPAEAPDLAPFIASEVARSTVTQPRLLVYVGASWCEPCQRFHAALSAGQLDRELAGVRFLEFDYDKSSTALKRAGYVSKLIPLFALPGPDGKASERQIEGSIKGPGAVAENLLPRLRALLAGDASAR